MGEYNFRGILATNDPQLRILVLAKRLQLFSNVLSRHSQKNNRDEVASSGDVLTG